MPRAATSVATSTRRSRVRRPCSTRLRRPCGMPPCSDATRWPMLGQAVGQPVGVALRAGEDQRLVDRRVRVSRWSSSAFLCCAVVGPVQALLDVGVGVGVRARRRCAAGRAAAFCARRPTWPREGGAEHQRLALAAAGGRRSCRMSSMKPMSSMRSASSSTSISTLLEDRPCRSAGGPSGGRAWRSGCRAGRAAPCSCAP